MPDEQKKIVFNQLGDFTTVPIEEKHDLFRTLIKKLEVKTQKVNIVELFKKYRFEMGCFLRIRPY